MVKTLTPKKKKISGLNVVKVAKVDIKLVSSSLGHGLLTPSGFVTHQKVNKQKLRNFKIIFFVKLIFFFIIFFKGTSRMFEIHGGMRQPQCQNRRGTFSKYILQYMYNCI